MKSILMVLSVSSFLASCGTSQNDPSHGNAVQFPQADSGFASAKSAYEKGTLPTTNDLTVSMTGRCYEVQRPTAQYAAFFLGRKFDQSVDAATQTKFAAVWQVFGAPTRYDTAKVKDLEAEFAKAAKDWGKVTATRVVGTALESSVVLDKVAGVFVESAKMSGKAIVVKVENVKLPDHNAYCRFERTAQ